MMDLVQIETPLVGTSSKELADNLEYAVACLRNSLLRGEAPFASHLLYTQALDDRLPVEREAGILAGFAVMERADKVAVYIDRGISPGMRRGIENALRLGKTVVYRTEKQPTADLPMGLRGVHMGPLPDEG